MGRTGQNNKAVPGGAATPTGNLTKAWEANTMGNVAAASEFQIDNNILIIRTSKKTLPGVVKHSKHALKICPRLRDGDIVLIAKLRRDMEPGEEGPICHAMAVHSVYRGKRESKQIWGKCREWIIEGDKCLRLKHPFDIARIQVTQTNYKQGGPSVYVSPEDKKCIRDHGYLAVADDEGMCSDSCRDHF